VQNNQSLKRQIGKLLLNETGKDIAKLLKREFDGDAYKQGDPYHTAYLAGQRSVIIYLEEASRDGTASSND
jgi:hypothetical protein